ITLSSFCDNQKIVMVGPFVVIPLPIIPNVFGLFDFGSRKPANLFLEIKAPPGTLNWENVVITMSLNGTLLNRINEIDNSSVWVQERHYVFESKIRCTELEDS